MRPGLRIARFGQGGQSLAEFVLSLPVILLVMFGLIQLALLGVVAVFGHYAAGCALRSYTVFHSQGKGLALQKAGRSMEQAFAWCSPMPDLELEISEDGPSRFRAQLAAEVPLLVSLRGRRTLDLHFHASIRRESLEGR